MAEWSKERARAALRFPRPCKCFEEGTLDQLPACRDGLCDDAVRSIAAALEEAAARERERCAQIAERGYCTASGCDLQTTGHSNLCPMGIADAIRADERIKP